MSGRFGASERLESTERRRPRASALRRHSLEYSRSYWDLESAGLLAPYPRSRQFLGHALAWRRPGS